MTNLIFSLTFFIAIVVFTSCEDASPDPEPAQTYRVNGQMTVDGRARTYLLNLPPRYYADSSKFSLVIALHGAGGKASQFEQDYGFTNKANDAGFIVVYPEGVQSNGVLGLRTWNAGTCCDYALENHIDDVNFIRALIDSLVIRYRVEPRKIYATGMSNGGMMAYRLACEMPEKIAAIAAVSATMVVAQPCDPSLPVPILHMHAALDAKVPYQGGIGLRGYYFPPVDSVLAVWSAKDACSETAPVVVQNNQYKFTSWSACGDDAVIECYLTADGGHAWPGSSKAGRRGDTPSTAINANDLIWEFFQRFER